jgi:hypothetical protein
VHTTADDELRHPNYDTFNVYGLQRELGWPTQQQPAVSQQPQFLPNYHVPPAPNPALHVAYPMQSQGPVPTLHVPAPKSTRKQPPNAAKEPSEPKYSARNLLDIVQTAIEVGLFTAKHGEKGKKLIEFGTAVRKLGIPGSDATLKSRLLEVMNFHEVRLLIYLHNHNTHSFKGSGYCPSSHSQSHRG